MGRNYRFLAGAACLPLAVCAAGALGQETTTYSYDELGRLTGSVISGGSNGGKLTGTCFDRAGNRMRYDVATGLPAACPTPGPVPTPVPTPTPAPTPTPTPTPKWPAEIAISDADGVVEGGILVFSVKKTGTTTSNFTVNYSTADGAAIAGSDYVATSGTLTFTPADIVKTISVTTIDDTITEPSETMLVKLSGVSDGAVIGVAQAAGVIFDNDNTNQPPVAVNDTGSMTKCSSQQFPVLANDYDPDGNTPLTLVSASYSGDLGSAGVVSNMVYFTSLAVAGTASVTYVIRDTLGATASGIINISIAGRCDPG